MLSFLQQYIRLQHGICVYFYIVNMYEILGIAHDTHILLKA